jgi:hypothetical protein
MTTAPDPRDLAPWIADAAKAIRSKLADAQAHAEKALTDTLKSTPDGRKTRRKASSSPSYAAAINRLDELADDLLKLTRRARETFYRTAHATYAPAIPPALLVSPDPKPTLRNVARFVAILIHGNELRDDLATPIERYKSALLPTLTLAGREAESGRTATDRIKGWRTKAEAALNGTVRTALSDSQMAATTEAGRDLIHPKFIEG